ncbi:HAD-IIB family hydrolase [Metalysinibacillus jejuensis]|uniref:HAD-IIB family hydrolase n=1 Tax=Metalysinibacillus jejuensis TaxID=914327 RepID=UPI000D3A22C6|nr:HAD family hydrolase [Metalysinibacillus jejuensis]
MNFVFDLDGTICFKGVPVTNKILNALEKVQLRGHNVIFASARPIRDMLPVLDKKFHTYTMIGGNGSLVSRNGNLIHTNSFTDEQVQLIKLIIDQFNATYLVDGEWDYSYTGPQDHPILKNLDPSKLATKVDFNIHKSIIKILILTSDNMEGLTEKVAELDVVTNKHGNENVLDISPQNVHKWNAISRLGINKGEYIAFGNDANDITMFMNAKHSVIIGEHKELSKHASEAIPLDEDTEDQIVEKLEQFLQVYEFIENPN